MSWRILDLENFEGTLSYTRGNVKVTKTSGEEFRCPLEDVAVVLCGPKCTVSTGLLQMLGERDISLFVTDWRHIPVSLAHGWSTHTRVGARQIAQARLSVPRSKNAWQQIVKAKIDGQAQVQKDLQHHAAADHLFALARSVRSGDPQNVEGQAAKYHWKHYVPDGSFIRDPDRSDRLNSLLNYGYTILRGFSLRSLSAAGLWPAVGLFHHGRSNAFNLADDIMEPFRPVVDHLVACLPEDAEISNPQTKRQLAAVSDQIFQGNGKTVATTLTDVARDLGRYVEGDILRLPVPRWTGPR